MMSFKSLNSNPNFSSFYIVDRDGHWFRINSTFEYQSAKGNQVFLLHNTTQPKKLVNYYKTPDTLPQTGLAIKVIQDKNSSKLIREESCNLNVIAANQFLNAKPIKLYLQQKSEKFDTRLALLISTTDVGFLGSLDSVHIPNSNDETYHLFQNIIKEEKDATENEPEQTKITKKNIYYLKILIGKSEKAPEEVVALMLRIIAEKLWLQLRLTKFNLTEQQQSSLDTLCNKLLPFITEEVDLSFSHSVSGFLNKKDASKILHEFVQIARLGLPASSLKKDRFESHSPDSVVDFKINKTHYTLFGQNPFGPSKLLCNTDKVISQKPKINLPSCTLDSFSFFRNSNPTLIYAPKKSSITTTPLTNSSA